MNVPLFAAGCLGMLGAAIHGVAGELLVVRKLSPSVLPSSALGGPRMTRTMIHVTWHITTFAFVTVAVALLLSGTVLNGDAARALSLLAAGACTGFAALVLAMGTATLSPWSLLSHPAPALLIATAALAWLGAL
jgi:hypothetical protein